MKIINIKKEITNLKGIAVKDEKGEPVLLGFYLGEILLTDKNSGKMKSYILAQKCVSDEKEIQVDEADFTIIKNAVEKTEIVNNLVSGQILVYLESIK